MIHISSMQDEDLEEVAELDSENLSCWAILHFRQQLSSPHAFHFIARESINHKLLGFICGHLVVDEAEIHKITVAQAHRRQAIGSQLMAHTFSYLNTKNCPSCFLELRRSNAPAQSLYNSFGFQPVGVRKKYYNSPPEDAIIMRRSQ